MALLRLEKVDLKTAPWEDKDGETPEKEVKGGRAVLVAEALWPHLTQWFYSFIRFERNPGIFFLKSVGKRKMRSLE